MIQEKIKKPLAEELLFGRLVHGGAVHVDLKDDALVFDIQPSPRKGGGMEKDRHREPELV